MEVNDQLCSLAALFQGKDLPVVIEEDTWFAP
jgi:hypothetical protein